MDESEPVDENEFVYRRIHPRFYDALGVLPVAREAFRPNAKDISGLSVFRARFAKPEDQGCGGSKAEPVRLPHDLEPGLGRALERLNLLADLVVENLGAAPRDRVEAGRHQALEHGADGDFFELGDVADFLG